MTLGDRLHDRAWHVGFDEAMRRIQGDIESHAEEIRALQAETGLDKGRTFYLRMYSLDVRRAGDPHYRQAFADRRLRFGDGRLDVLPPSAEYDGHFATDVVTAMSLARGRLRLPDGREVPYDPTRAWLSGHILGVPDFDEMKHITLADLLLTARAFPLVFTRLGESDILRTLGPA